MHYRLNQRYSNGIILFPILILFFLSCKPDFSIGNLTIDTNNALRAVINFDTPEESLSIIEYWISGQPDRLNTIKSKFSKEHRIILYKLKPDTQYDFVIKANFTNELLISDTAYFKTNSYPLPEPRFTLTIDSGDVFTGYILIRKVEYPSQQIILDNQGRIVWYQLLDSAVTRFYSWTENQTILSLNTEDHIQEFDLEGNILFELKLGEKGFSKHLHHDIIRDEKKNILSLTRNMKLFDLTKFGGIKEDTVFGDGILVLDSTGNKVWEWDIYQHHNPLEHENIEQMKKDWSHGNALGIDLDGNYLVSFRNFHQIWKIDSESGEIVWKLGLNGDFEIKKEDLFYSQHSVFINRFGELMLFDNGLPGTVSRAISFKIKSDSIALGGQYNVSLPPDLYTVKEGSAYLIEPDKILFSSTRNNVIVITDKEENILWQLNTPEPVYRAYYLEEGLFDKL